MPDAISGGCRRVVNDSSHLGRETRYRSEMKKGGKTNTTVKRAKRLLKAIEKHAKDAMKQGVPRAIYVQSVADHAAATYDRLIDEKRADESEDDQG
jgi:hypothetical protein